MIEYLGRELASTSVATLLVYPSWVRTVNLGMGFDLDAAGLSPSDFEQMTQSPYLIGRAIAELFADREVQSKSGKTLYAGEVALEYGFTDIDGPVPAYDGGELAPNGHP